MEAKAPFPGTCPSCGGFLSGNGTTCPSCGAVLPLEAALQDLRYKAQGKLEAVMQSVRRQPTYWAAWALAVVPLFVLPPLAAILLSLSSRDQTNRSSMLIVIAAANVILSLCFWATAADLLIAHLAVVRDWLFPAVSNGQSGVIKV